MKKLIRADEDIDIVEDQIRITMYLYPLIYESSEILSAVNFDSKSRKYNTDVNPSRILNGPLSGPGEELEAPLKDEWESFIEDCKWMVKEVGFTIIDSKTSETSKKSEYIITFGLENNPCGSIVYDLQISDHPFDATFPESAKDKALEYLKINKVLDGTATKAGIDFQVEKVTVGGVKEDSWNRAFQRLHQVLKQMKSKVQIRLNRNNSQ